MKPLAVISACLSRIFGHGDKLSGTVSAMRHLGLILVFSASVMVAQRPYYHRSSPPPPVWVSVQGRPYLYYSGNYFPAAYACQGGPCAYFMGSYVLAPYPQPYYPPQQRQPYYQQKQQQQSQIDADDAEILKDIFNFLLKVAPLMMEP